MDPFEQLKRQLANASPEERQQAYAQFRESVLRNLDDRLAALQEEPTMGGNEVTGMEQREAARRAEMDPGNYMVSGDGSIGFATPGMEGDSSYRVAAPWGPSSYGYDSGQRTPLAAAIRRGGGVLRDSAMRVGMGDPRGALRHLQQGMQATGGILNRDRFAMGEDMREAGYRSPNGLAARLR